MENDYIITSAQQENDVYFILDGDAEIMKDSTATGQKLGPGDFCGGLIPNIIQLRDIKVTTTFMKVAILDQNTFHELMEAYPEWYDTIVKSERVHRTLKKFIRKLKNQVAERSKKEWMKANEEIPKERSPKQSKPNPLILSKGPSSPAKKEGIDSIQRLMLRPVSSSSAGVEVVSLKTKLPSENEALMGRQLEEEALKSSDPDFKLQIKSLTELQKKSSTTTMERSNSVSKFKASSKEHELHWYIHPNSNWRYIYEIAHTLMILYSIFAVPIYIGFQLEPTANFIVLEVLCLVEQVIYLICIFRTPQYGYGYLTFDWKIMWPALLEKGLILELIALIPLNLALGLAEAYTPVWIMGILRSGRILLVAHLPAQFSIIESRWLRVTPYFKVLKSVVYLAFVWNFASCLWAFFMDWGLEENYDLTFNDVLDMDIAPLWQRYIYCILFTMSLATTTGYPEMIIYNNYERALFIFYAYLGDAFFALTWGWLAAHFNTWTTKYTYAIDRIMGLDYIMKRGKLPSNIKHNIQKYFAYIYDTQNKNNSSLESLSGLLPLSILKSMAHDQGLKYLNSVPLVQHFKDNNLVLDEIIRIARPTIFLPGDYITSKGETGTEMYVIAEGTVHMLSPNEKKALCVLEEGSYFCELSLYTTTKRLTPFTASTFCLIYVIDKQSLEGIFEKFPGAEFDFQQFAKNRREELTVLGTTRAEQLHEAFKMMKKTCDKKEEIEELLRAAEVPYYEKSHKEDKMIIVESLGEQEGRQIDYHEKKEFEEKDSDEKFGALDSDEEFIDDEEMEFKDAETRKNTFRTMPRSRERRYSRVNLKKEIKTSKSGGLVLRCGLHMENL